MTATSQNSTRFVVLDVFRGMTIFLMIIVNTPGGGAMPFSPLLHAKWHGFTLTDLVFPSFLFAVGNAMAFSLKKYSSSDYQFFIKIIKRTLLIFAIGYFLNWILSSHWTNSGGLIINSLRNVRILGVLQRIALCYGLGAIILHYFQQRTVIIISTGILLAYWLVLYLFPIIHADPYSITGNAELRLDRFLFNERNLYHGEGMAFDPEGVLSTLPAIVNVIAGYLIGVLIQKHGRTFECVARLLLIGNVLIIAALFWNLTFPINKKIWTSSYVLLTVGIDSVVIGILLYIIEIKNIAVGSRFFTILGKNPLFLYILSESLWLFLVIPVGLSTFYDWINTHIYQFVAPGPIGSLLFAVSCALFCWFVGWILDKYKIYIRI